MCQIYGQFCESVCRFSASSPTKARLSENLGKLHFLCSSAKSRFSISMIALNDWSEIPWSQNWHKNESHRILKGCTGGQKYHCCIKNHPVHLISKTFLNHVNLRMCVHLYFGFLSLECQVAQFWPICEASDKKWNNSCVQNLFQKSRGRLRTWGR